MKNSIKIISVIMLLAVLLTACAQRQAAIKPVQQAEQQNQAQEQPQQPTPETATPAAQQPAAETATPTAPAASEKTDPGISDSDISAMEKELNSPIEEDIETTTFQ